jgi:hypothetical protein
MVTGAERGPERIESAGLPTRFWGFLR